MRSDFGPNKGETMIRSILLLALLLPAALPSEARAGPVRIADFKFECVTPAGQRLKPQFGDMDGMYYSEIAGNEDACAMAVKSRIANCHQHTRFLSPGDNRKYPDCLPIFRRQAEACRAHFRRELPKCRSGATAAQGGSAGSGQQSLQVLRKYCTDRYGAGWQPLCMPLPADQRDAVINFMGLKPGPKDSCGGRSDWSFCGKPK